MKKLKSDGWWTVGNSDFFNSLLISFQNVTSSCRFWQPIAISPSSNSSLCCTKLSFHMQKQTLHVFQNWLALKYQYNFKIRLDFTVRFYFSLLCKRNFNELFHYSNIKLTIVLIILIPFHILLLEMVTTPVSLDLWIRHVPHQPRGMKNIQMTK